MAKSKLQQIKEWLKANVSYESMLQALGGKVLDRGDRILSAKCINPDHNDGELDGGSLKYDTQKRRWTCFACTPDPTGHPRGGDIFDLYELKHRLVHGTAAAFIQSLRGVAEINAAALAVQFGQDWRAAFGHVQPSSAAARFTKTLAGLARVPAEELPILSLSSTERLPGYWLEPQSEARNVLASTAGPDAQAVRDWPGRVKLVVLEQHGLMAFCREDYSLLGVAGDDIASFSKKVGVPEVTNGRYLNHRDAPVLAEPLVSLLFTVENPLDLHMLGLASQPAVLGRFNPRAQPMLAASQDRRMLALLALLPTQPAGAARRFESLLKHGQAWIPKTFPLQGLSSLVTVGVDRTLALALQARREAYSPQPRVAPLL